MQRPVRGGKGNVEEMWFVGWFFAEEFYGLVCNCIGVEEVWVLLSFVFDVLHAACECAGTEVGGAAIESAEKVIEAAFCWPCSIWLIWAIGQVPLAGDCGDVAVLFKHFSNSCAAVI